VRARHLEESTALVLGARGAVGGVPLTLASRTCIRGRRGALWNEWHLRLDDGRTLFLSESAAGFALYDEGTLLPSWGALATDRALDTGFVVVERGEAMRIARWGELDAAPDTFRYASLSSRTGARATIEYGEGAPRVFVGRRVSLSELALSARAERPHLVPVPELSRPKGVETWLSVGDEGELAGARSTVIGMLSRSTAGAEPTRWDEYLLYSKEHGLGWLVVADGHWSLVEPVEPGLVEEAPDHAKLAGNAYERIAEGVARVDWATGELPWEVTIGEESHVRDYAAPSSLLSKEWTPDEVTWSRATYVAPDLIAKAFRKRALPKPQ
jgi:hypothetical protein